MLGNIQEGWLGGFFPQGMFFLDSFIINNYFNLLINLHSKRLVGANISSILIKHSIMTTSTSLFHSIVSERHTDDKSWTNAFYKKQLSLIVALNKKNTQLLELHFETFICVRSLKRNVYSGWV